MLSLDMPITNVKNIGEKRAALYRKLGIQTVEDLLYHFPRSYIDFTSAEPINSRKIGETITVSAHVVQKFPPLKVRGGMTIFRLLIMDSEQNAITVTFFNNKFAFSALKQGQEYIFYGKLSGTFLRPEMSVPLFIPKTENAVMQPCYPLTSGLSNKMIANNIKDALSELEDIPPVCLPNHILEKEGLKNTKSAFYDINVIG